MRYWCKNIRFQHRSLKHQTIIFDYIISIENYFLNYIFKNIYVLQKYLGKKLMNGFFQLLQPDYLPNHHLKRKIGQSGTLDIHLKTLSFLLMKFDFLCEFFLSQRLLRNFHKDNAIPLLYNYLVFIKVV